MIDKIKLWLMKLINRIQALILKIEIWLLGKDTNENDEKEVNNGN